MPTKNRELQRKNQRAWYARNSKKHIANVTARDKKRAKEFQAYKNTLECCKCGEDTACCLDFHHRNPNQKEIEISKAIRFGWGKERLQKEIDKCDIVCKNCHAKIHAGVD